MSWPIRAIIVDDEPVGRDSVRALLACHPDIDPVTECATADEAVQAVQELRPDLLFLDVQLPGANGVEVLRRIPQEAMPLVVFVTAYDDYALHAFDVHAVDYLLKPYSDARFHDAVSRARERMELDRLERLRRGLLALARDAEPARAASLGGGTATGTEEAARWVGTRSARRSLNGYLERLTIRTEKGVSIVPVDEIAWVEAAGDHARVHLADRWVPMRSTMDKLERRLDPAKFVRIHRSTIVSVAFVRELRGAPSTEYVAVLRDGTTRAISGRGREQLSRALEVSL